MEFSRNFQNFVKGYTKFFGIIAMGKVENIDREVKKVVNL